ncbi:hypothetical protein GS511_00200 [Leptospira borgpetersenii]|nr:hypothetical protein B1H38_12355 [Leptospira borgpetersenii serovar Ballum]QHE25574.1 hypothetical protein GS524_00205 [Leptospira borgpetersenii]QHE28875.1 hypothetical protein GS523_00205 [Leptospira borgpetersenii]QHE32176.1 hypothetical protein GS517_00200 [Leptospira borgpetersenii]QHE35475.1 hypothetical protein GS510_00200 [Leptospira borgpetersenii]
MSQNLKRKKKSVQSFHKFVIECGNSHRSVIYGFSNGFYRWDILVIAPHLRSWDKFKVNISSF